MSLQTDLLALERKFWGGDAEFYRNNLDDRCLVTFNDMAGVKTRDEIAGMVKKDPPGWNDLKMDDKGLVEPVQGMAVLSYEARARRGNGEPYHAMVSSGYVKRDGGWKMAFHQQSPMKDDAKPATKH